MRTDKIHTFTSTTFVESLKAQDTNWNMDRYFDYENNYGIEGLVSSAALPMRNTPFANSTTQPNTLLRVEY
ncbi:hypothetical protein M405DRAFT_869446 [Rhizopogon salebrosus TDB-379]|nr:hypothetical protein M405DRAFT_869446 [Rhizopogon salebrosus TDB-379]